MRCVLQKVLRASVDVDGERISEIGRGLLALIGIAQGDTHDDLCFITDKLLGLKVFEDENGTHWKRSVKDIEGELLCVSQFTLLAHTRKGLKPDFHAAMTADSSRDMYATVLKRLGDLYQPDRIKDGKFAAMMQVSLCNDGPVTICLDSHDTRKSSMAAPSEDTAAAAKAQRRAEQEARTAANKEAKEQAQ